MSCIVLVIMSHNKCSSFKVYEKSWVTDDWVFCVLQGSNFVRPLTRENEDTHVLHGLVSRGDSGTKNEPVVYARSIYCLNYIK